jgi:DNA repair protein RadC
MKNPILASEYFSNGKMHYFLDFKLAINNKNYIEITRSDELADKTYKRSSVRVFEEDFEFLIQAFSSLFISAAYQGRLPDMAGHITPKENPPNGIKSWEPGFRPREKLMEQGRAAMDDAELLAMLIGSGTPRETAVDLAERILASVDHDLKRLAELNADDLCLFHGMGIAKSLSIISSMELASRLTERSHKKVWLKKAAG